MEGQEYICTVCKAKVAAIGEEIPQHCGKEMKTFMPLEPCTGVDAEMARDGEMSEPCDDGRGQGSQ